MSKGSEQEPVPAATAVPWRPTERDRRPIKWLLILLLVPVYEAIPVAAALVARTAGIEAFELEGPSMEPSLFNGERVVIDKTAYGFWLPFQGRATRNWAAPALGEVVVLRSPADRIDVVKRVVGLAGDRIEIREDRIWRNGRPVPTVVLERCPALGLAMELPDTAASTCSQETLGGRQYLTMTSPRSTPSSIAAITVPPRHVYVLGDHRDHSNDSRYLGPIAQDAVKGPASIVYWSGDRARIGTRF